MGSPRGSQEAPRSLSRRSRGRLWRLSPGSSGRQTWRRGRTRAARKRRPKARCPDRNAPGFVFRALFGFQDPGSFSGAVFVFRGRRPKRGRGPTLPANRAKQLFFLPRTLDPRPFLRGFSFSGARFRFQGRPSFSGPLVGFQDPFLVFRTLPGFQGGAFGVLACGRHGGEEGEVDSRRAPSTKAQKHNQPKAQKQNLKRPRNKT